MTWTHQGWSVWVLRLNGLTAHIRPNSHAGRYYLLVTDQKSHALFDSKGDLEDLKDIARLWMESRAK